MNSNNNLTNHLKNNYPDIINSIEKEGYLIDYQDFDQFAEIIYEDEIIGFFTLQDSVNFANTKEISEIYIQPEYRGNNIFYDTLIYLMSNAYYNIVFKKVSRDLIHVLIKNNLCYKINDKIILSFIYFTFNLKDSYRNSNLKRLYKKIKNEDLSFFSNIYDTEINCILFQDPIGIISKKEENLVIVEPRKYDLKKYDMRKKLKKITPKYLENFIMDYETNMNTFEYFKSLEKYFDPIFSLDNILGTENELKSEVVEYLNLHDLSVEDGFKIRQSINHALQTSEITPKAIVDRFGYLVYNFNQINNKLDNNSLGCPFCGAISNEKIGTCRQCGHEYGMYNHSDEEEDMIDMDYSDDSRYSIKNNEFLYELDDMNQKFKAIFGENFDLAMEYLKKGDLDHISQLLKKEEELVDVDWYVQNGNVLDNQLMRLVGEKNYNIDEVFDAQSRICEYECVKHVNENITSWKMDNYSKINHIDYDSYTIILDKGYVKKLSREEFRQYLSQYSIKQLTDELKYFDIEARKTKEEIIEQFIKEGDFTLITTPEGEDYLKSHPEYDYFATYLSDFLFYEYEEYLKTHEGDISEISEKYLKEEFKKGIIDGNLDIYLNYLDYYYNIAYQNKDYSKALYYLIQRFIYETNKWYAKPEIEFLKQIYSRKTAKYFNNIIFIDFEYEFNEIYDNAFNKFKFSHMKNNKDKIHEFVQRLLAGEHIIIINNELLEENIS